MKSKTNGILSGILFVTLFLSGCKASQIIGINDNAVETDNQGLIIFDDEESNDELTEAEVDERTTWQIGLSLPRSGILSSNRSEAEVLRKQVLNQGYSISGFAPVDTVEDQINQIRIMLNVGVDALIIQPIDPNSLAEVLELATEKNITIFSYGDLILNSDAVNYLVSYDYRFVGQNAAKKMIEDFDLENRNDNPVTIEFLAADCSSMNDRFYYYGVLEELQPYIESGSLVVPSGIVEMEDASVWKNGGKEFDSRSIEARMDDMMLAFPDIICTSSDIISQQVIEYLEKKGMKPDPKEFFVQKSDEVNAENEKTDEVKAGKTGEDESKAGNSPHWPYITGLGCTKESVKQIVENKQRFTLLFDERELAEKCVTEINNYLSNLELEVSDYGTYDNGTRVVGALLCPVQIIDIDDYPILFDNGYYEETEIEPFLDSELDLSEEKETE